MNLIPTDICQIVCATLFKLTKRIQLSFNRPHPRWKRQIADRLWVGALQLGYNITSQGRFQGPFPSNFILAGNRRMEIDYDNFQVELEFRDLEATSFEVGT